MEKFYIGIIGPLCVQDRCGNDITPARPRVRALLALIATPPLRKRTRRWLAAHLWSDKPYAKSSMSLRQLLHELRGQFSDDRSVVRSSRTEIWLDPDRVTLDLPSKESGRASGVQGELLEGLDIEDPAFEDWIRDLRLSHHSPETAAEPIKVTLGGLNVRARVGSFSSEAGRVTAGLIADQVSQNVEDMIGSVRLDTPVGRSDLEITTHISETRTNAVLCAKVIHGPTDAVLYSGQRHFAKDGGVVIGPGDVAEFAHAVATRAVAKLPHLAALDRDEIVALGMAEVGRRRLFGYTRDGLDEAGSLFARAFNTDPGGVYLAWQAFHKTALVIEGLVKRTPALLEECDGQLRRAAELSPESAQTFALIALVRLLLLNDTAGGLSAAKAGLRRNPNSLYARQALAMAAGSFGDKTTAYEATSFCRPALVNDDARHLWELYHGLVCISTGRLEEARHALNHAAALCPAFKAPHRQLIALNIHFTDHNEARRNVAALKGLEPEFSIDRYRRDPEYPVATLRQMRLLDQSFQEVT